MSHSSNICINFKEVVKSHVFLNLMLVYIVGASDKKRVILYSQTHQKQNERKEEWGVTKGNSLSRKIKIVSDIVVK